MTQANEAERNMIQEFMAMERMRKIECFRQLNRHALPGQIVMAGSSLMEGFPVNELMGSFWVPGVVYNRGIGGITSDVLIEALDPCILDLKPSRLFINIGTNDLAQPGFTLQRLEENYRLILGRVRSALPDCRICLMAYYPMNELDRFNGIENNMMQASRSNRLLDACNGMIERMAMDLGHIYLDLNAPLRDERGQLKAEFTVEGVHLYPNAYVEVFKGLVPYLAQS